MITHTHSNYNNNNKNIGSLGKNVNINLAVSCNIDPATGASVIKKKDLIVATRLQAYG